MAMSSFCGSYDFILACVGLAETNIVPDTYIKQEVILRNEGNLFGKLMKRYFLCIHTAKRNHT